MQGITVLHGITNGVRMFRKPPCIYRYKRARAHQHARTRHVVRQCVYIYGASGRMVMILSARERARHRRKNARSPWTGFGAACVFRETHEYGSVRITSCWKLARKEHCSFGRYAKKTQNTRLRTPLVTGFLYLFLFLFFYRVGTRS